MLVGRRSEERAVTTLADGARAGRSGVLVVVGEAGSGKTALLSAVARTLTDMRVHRVAGTEAERDLGFGGLSQIVGAGAADIAALPAPQAAALEIALNLRSGSSVDRLAVGAGTLGLLTHRAEAGPLAVLVDDAHLLDHSSAEALTFAARRLLVDRVLLLAAVRAGEESPLLRAGLPQLRLTGLDVAAARQLLADRTGHRPPVALAQRLVRATGGNPLALLELGRDRHGLETLGPTDPIAVRAAVARAFLTRVQRLTDEAQDALLVAAASAGDPVVVADACRALGTDPAALGEAEDAGLLTRCSRRPPRRPHAHARRRSTPGGSRSRGSCSRSTPAP